MVFLMILRLIIRVFVVCCVNVNSEHSDIVKTEDIDGSSQTIERDDSIISNNLKKRPYSYKPSCLIVEFDAFRFLFEKCRHVMSYYDINLRSMIDFNRILFLIDFGILKVDYGDMDSIDRNLKFGRYYGLSVGYNLMKKNNKHDVFFVSCGAYFASNGALIKDTIIGMYDVYFKLQIGVVKNIYKFLSIGSALSCNFFRVNLMSRSTDVNSISLEDWGFPCVIAGYGDPRRKFTLNYHFYICISIPLFSDKRCDEDDCGFFIKKNV